MITVLWEDQLGGQVKSFGPHELLLACVADDLGRSRFALKYEVVSVPKKGNSNVRRTLQLELDKLRGSGQVCAVLDLDQVLNLWHSNRRPNNCFSGIREALSEDAPGDYEVVFLVENIESVIAACCNALSEPVPSKKPSLNERDRILSRVAAGSVGMRHVVRNSVPSFDRVVRFASANLVRR